MSKTSIKSTAVVQDIRIGLDDDELMQKYGLSATQLARVLTQLVGTNRITQEELDTRGLILDDQPVREVKISPVRIPVFIATSLLCSVLFGWPFLLKQQKLISGGLDMFYLKDYEGIPFDYGDLLQYILTLVTLAALTVVPPIIVWVWTPAWEVIRKSVHRFVKYKRFTARNIICVVIGILFLLGVLYFWPSIYWIWKVSRANAGDASAQYFLGLQYTGGQYVPQNYSKSVDWLRKAAEQGYAPAQFVLAHMYDTGQGVPKDEKKAVNWYRKAAEQGDVMAQGALGSAYESGSGVPVDFKMAAFWYQKAADQGLELAKNGLARTRGR